MPLPFSSESAAALPTLLRFLPEGGEPLATQLARFDGLAALVRRRTGTISAALEQLTGRLAAWLATDGSFYGEEWTLTVLQLIVQERELEDAAHGESSGASRAAASLVALDRLTCDRVGRDQLGDSQTMAGPGT